MIDGAQSPAGTARPGDLFAPDGRLLASAGARFLARLIDAGVLLAAYVAVLALLFGAAAVARAAGGTLPPAVIAVGVALAVLGLPYLYEVEFARRRGGRTLGKQALHLAIAPLAAGCPLSRGGLAKRWATTLVFNILTTVYVGYLDVLWLLWDKPYRQCLHDKAAGTVVVQVPR
jgi:uncharacterized RDD family membrane protein YckC